MANCVVLHYVLCYICLDDYTVIDVLLHLFTLLHCVGRLILMTMIQLCLS